MYYNGFLTSMLAYSTGNFAAPVGESSVVNLVLDTYRVLMGASGGAGTRTRTWARNGNGECVRVGERPNDVQLNAPDADPTTISNHRYGPWEVSFGKSHGRRRYK